MKFKDSLKRNDYNTLSIIIFSTQTLIFLFFFTRDGEMRGERERREKRETKIEEEERVGEGGERVKF